MIALFGAYYRIRRLGGGLKELWAMAPDARLSIRSAAELLGVRPATLRALLVRYEPCLAINGRPVSPARLRHILRTARVPHGR